METQTVYVTKHTLSTLFEKTLKLLKPTWKPSLIICAVLYVPIAVATAFFMQSYIGFMIDLVNMAEGLDGAPLALLGRMLPFLGFVLLYALLAGIVETFASGVLSRNAFRSATGEAPGWKELMLETLRGKLGSLVAFFFLQGLIGVGVVLVFAVLISLAVVVGTIAKMVVLSVLLTILFYLALILALVAMQYVFQFGPAIIVNEDSGPGAAIARSFSLLKGEFFRVVGISILFGMALSLALSMVTMPLQFASLAPFYAKFLQAAMNGASSDTSSILLEMADAFKGFGFLYGLLIAVQSILSGMVHPLFTTLFYLDLRVRKGELADAATFSDLSGQGRA